MEFWSIKRCPCPWQSGTWGTSRSIPTQTIPSFCGSQNWNTIPVEFYRLQKHRSQTGTSCWLRRLKQVWDLAQSLQFVKEKWNICLIVSLAVLRVAFVHVLIYRASLYQAPAAGWINNTQYLFLSMWCKLLSKRRENNSDYKLMQYFKWEKTLSSLIKQ